MGGKQKKILIAAAAVVAAAGLGTGIWFWAGRQAGPSEEAIAAVEIAPQKEGAWGVEADSAFTVKAGRGMTEETLRGLLTFDPPIAYTLASGGGGEWVLTPDAPLEENRVYAVRVLSREGGPLRSFAFQTRTGLAVSSVYPDDGSDYVDTSTGIEITFNASGVSLEGGFAIEPEVAGRFEQNGYSAAFIPEKPLDGNSVYRVTLSGDLQSADGRRLGEEYRFSFTTRDESGRDRYDDLRLRSEFVSAHLPGDPIRMRLGANEDMHGATFQVDVHRFADVDAYAAEIRARDAFYRERTGRVRDYRADTSALTQAATAQLPLDFNDEFGYDSSVLLPGELEEGCYIATLSGTSPTGYEQFVQMMFQVANLSVYTQSANGEVLLWLNDPVSGRPVSGAQFSVEDADGARLDSAATGDDGLAAVEFGDVERNASTYMSLSSGEKLVFFAPVQARAKQAERVSDRFSTAVYTDRELYRPQDTVRFWGAMRPLHGDALPREIYAALSTSWPRTELLRVPVSVGTDGTFSGELPVESLVMDWYSLTLTDGTRETEEGEDGHTYYSKSLEVKDFTTPPFSIEITHSKDWYYANEPIDIQLSASYYDGTPVAGGNLSLQSGGITELRFGQEVTLDEYGKATFTGTWAPYSEDIRAWPDGCWIGVNSADAQDVYISSNSVVKVVPSRYFVDLENTAPGVLDIRSALFNTAGMDEGVSRSGGMFEQYAGAAADVAMTVTVTKSENVKTPVDSYYDNVTKRTVTKYRYERRETVVGTYEVATRNGSAQLTDLPTYTAADDPSVNYEITARYDGGLGHSIVANAWIDRDSGEEEIRYAFFGDIEDNAADPRRVKDGGDVVLGLYGNGRAVANEGRVFYTVYQRGLCAQGVFTGERETFAFTQELQPNVTLSGAYFDGRYVRTVNSDRVRLDYTDKTLAVEVRADRESYQPGETAALTVTLRDATGNPVSGTACIGVVDESVFALAEQEVDFVDELYRSIYYAEVRQNVATSYRTESEPEEAGEMADMATGGGGGMDGSVRLRSEFLDTALFQTVAVGESGEATAELKLPDNVTGWRLTAAAVTPDYKAGSGVGAAVASLPFVVRPLVSDAYVEGDSVWVSALGTGPELGTQTDYTATLTPENGEQTVRSFTGKVGERTPVELGKLPVGEYRLVFEARCGEYADSVEAAFSVVEKGFARRAVRDVAVEELAALAVSRYPVKVTLYDESMKAYMKGIETLCGMDSERTEIIAAAYGARLLAGELLGEEDIPRERRLEEAQREGGVSMLPESGPDAAATAKLLVAAPNLVRVGEAKEYLLGVLRDVTKTQDDRVMAYLGLAAQGEPVLLDVQRSLTDSAMTQEQKLYLGSALALLGDLDAAKEIYAQYAPGEDAAEAQKGAALLLAALCGDESAEGWMLSLCETVAKRDESRMAPVTLEMLTYLNRYELPQEGETAVTYLRNGETVTENIKGFTALTLGRTALKEAQMSVKAGGVRALVSFEGFAEPQEKNTQAVVTKTISTVKGGGLAVPAMAKVTLDITLPDDAPAGSYRLTDRIPSGMRYLDCTIGGVEELGGIWGGLTQEGQMVSRYLYVADEEEETPQPMPRTEEAEVIEISYDAGIVVEKEPIEEDDPVEVEEPEFFEESKPNPGTEEAGGQRNPRHFRIVYYVSCSLPGEYVSQPVVVERTEGGFYAESEETVITIQ